MKRRIFPAFPSAFPPPLAPACPRSPPPFWMLIIAMKCASALAPKPIFSNDCILPSSQLLPATPEIPPLRCCRFKCTKARQRTCQGQTLVEPREGWWVWVGVVGGALRNLLRQWRQNTSQNGDRSKREFPASPCPSPSPSPMGTPIRLCGFYNFKIYLRASGSFPTPDKCMRLLAETRQKVSTPSSTPGDFPAFSTPAAYEMVENAGGNPGSPASSHPGLPCPCVCFSVCKSQPVTCLSSKVKYFAAGKMQFSMCCVWAETHTLAHQLTHYHTITQAVEKLKGPASRKMRA